MPGAASDARDERPRSGGSAVALRRGPSVSRGPAARRLPRWLAAALAVPLTVKLVGANLLVAAAAAAAHVVAAPGVDADVTILGAALVVALAVNCALVRLALRPVRELESAASRVWRGDFSARVIPSPVADAEIARLGRTVNLLLDALEDDRERMRSLAALTIRAQDDERARIARELHDSSAQTLAALTYQLAAAARDSRDPALAERLMAIRGLAGDALEELRAMAHTIHPSVLDDLGLVTALEWLARKTREHSSLQLEVDSSLDGDAGALSREAAAALYRVAQESLRNVERHAGASHARLHLSGDGGAVILEVADDGRGFDLEEAEARRPGMGLFAMRERVALVGGALHVDTRPGAGTRVRARVPFPR